MSSPGKISAPTLTILYGTQTGNAEIVAMDAADAAKEIGIDVSLYALDEFPVDQLAELSNLLLVSSTYDDGEMPDNAQDFWDDLVAQRPQLSELRYAVLALGDSSYPDFCAAGKHFDEKLSELGAVKLLDRGECDVAFERTSAAYAQRALQIFAGTAEPESGGGESVSKSTKPDAPESNAPESAANGPAGSTDQQWSRSHPFEATVIDTRLLSKPGSTKQVHTYRIDLRGAAMQLHPGDSIGIIPDQDPDLVEAVAAAFGLRGVSGHGPSGTTVADALADRELRLPTTSLIVWALQRSGDDDLITVAEDRTRRQQWAHGRDAADLAAVAKVESNDFAEFVELLSPLAHRTYSLASCPLTDPDHVEILVSYVNYEQHGRQHRGLASDYLVRTASSGNQVRVFPIPNELFRPPAAETPMIMIGPGAGVAPFRAFLQHRSNSGASGDNWLFFGDRNRDTDYLYEEDFTAMSTQGILHRIDVAFSRDQDQKRYVQHTMREAASEIVEWIDRGAAIYVCGDMSPMASDVEQTLIELLDEQCGNRDETGKTRLSQLKRDRRYLTDVY